MGFSSWIFQIHVGICTLSFQDSTLDLYYQLSTLESTLILLFHIWLMICNTKRKSCTASGILQPIYPSTVRNFSQNGGTCWELNWPPTVPQSLSLLYNSHQIPPTPYFVLFTPGLFSRISGRKNETVICGETLSSWESDYLTTSISLLQNCSELFPLWSNLESVASRHRWGCQENQKRWYSHVQTMTHSGEVSSVDQRSLGWQFCHQECYDLACANISNIYVTYMIKNQTKDL